MATDTEAERDVLIGHAATLAVPAVRYALGRRTYITGEVARVIRGLVQMGALSRNDIATIRSDIEMQEAREALGDQCDAEAWRSLLALLSVGREP